MAVIFHCVYLHTHTLSLSLSLPYFLLTSQPSILLLLIVQLLICILFFVTPWTAAYQASLSFTISQSLLKLTYIETVMLSNHLSLFHPLLLLPLIFPIIRVFSSESTLHIRWPGFWSLDFSISPSNEYWGLSSLLIVRNFGNVIHTVVFKMDNQCSCLLVSWYLVSVNHLIILHCLDVSKFAHSSPIARHLGCFQVLAVMNKVVI